MSKNLEINSYHQADEVMKLVGTDGPLAVNGDNFSFLIGDYYLPDFEPPLKCCCEKVNKNKCGRDHRRGYIVELKSNERSLLGSTCIKNFDPNGDLKSSVKYYDNRKRYLERLAYVNSCVNDKEYILAKLKEEANRLSELHHFVSGFIKTVPSKISRRLEGMAKTGNDAITVDVRIVKEAKNKETGDIERDIDTITHIVDKVNGLAIFKHESRLDLMASIKGKIALVNSLMLVDEKAKTRYVLKLYNELQEIDALCERSRTYCSNKFLFENSSWKGFIFLSDKVDDRIDFYRKWYFNKYMEPISKPSAMNEINEIDSRLIDQFGATKLIVAA